MGVLMLLAPFLHCIAVFFFSATTVRDYLSLAANEIPKEYGKREGKKAWSELGWPNRLRLLYLRLIHCLTTGLVPWVLRLEAKHLIYSILHILFRDWDVERRTFKYAEKNFYLARWNQVKEISPTIF